jgi:hypothetical protein
VWLFDIIKPLVKKVIVCNPRENHWLKQGNKTDKVDALKLARLLRAGLLKAVYHGSPSVRPLKDLAHAYDQLTRDRARVINRVKSIYRGQAIECGGTVCYQPRERERWLEKLESESLRQRAKWLLEELDVLSKAQARVVSGDGQRGEETRGLAVVRNGAGNRKSCHRTSDRGGWFAAQVSQQTAVLGILRVGGGDPFECRLRVCGRLSGQTQEFSDRDARLE